MIKNQDVILKIDNMSAEGSGVGRYENMAVFVPLTAVGDTVKVKIVKLKKTYAYGKLLEIIEPSNSRTEPDCPVFKTCGGCVYRHINYAGQCRIKEQKVYENIKRIGGADIKPQPIISAESPCRYRNKAQYPVSENGNVGFFATHSHRIIESNSCLLQPEIFDKICAVFSDFVRANNISVYSEETGKGLLRHLYLRIAEKTGEIMVCAVINGDSLPKSDVLLENLQNLLGENLKSFQLNINKKDTNVILGEKCVTLFGQDYITDVLCGVKFRISPLSFYQVNRTMAEKLYDKAAFYADAEGKNVIDLYCGAGTIGLTLAHKAKSVIGVEIVPEAIADAKINAKINGIENARFICGDAAASAQKLAKENIKADVVILDPPRKGCEESLIKTVANGFAPERVVYVSCDSATLARDIKIFAALGYKLIEYTPVDMFPATSHVETAALLVRTVSAI